MNFATIVSLKQSQKTDATAAVKEERKHPCFDHVGEFYQQVTYSLC